MGPDFKIMAGAQSVYIICISIGDEIIVQIFNSLRKGTSFEKTRHHHFHILLNAVQPDNVDKVKRDAGLWGASHSYVDAARASLAKSLHGCSWGFWVLGCSMVNCHYDQEY